MRDVLVLDTATLVAWRAHAGAGAVDAWWAANGLPPPELVVADSLAVHRRPDGSGVLRYRCLQVGRHGRIRDGQQPATVGVEQALVLDPAGLP